MDQNDLCRLWKTDDLNDRYFLDDIGREHSTNSTPAAAAARADTSRAERAVSGRAASSAGERRSGSGLRGCGASDHPTGARRRLGRQRFNVKHARVTDGDTNARRAGLQGHGRRNTEPERAAVASGLQPCVPKHIWRRTDWHRHDAAHHADPNRQRPVSCEHVADVAVRSGDRPSRRRTGGRRSDNQRERRAAAGQRVGQYAERAPVKPADGRSIRSRKLMFKGAAFLTERSRSTADEE